MDLYKDKFPHHMVLLIQEGKAIPCESVIIKFPHYMVLLIPSLTNIVILGIDLNIFMGVLRQFSNKPTSI